MRSMSVRMDIRPWADCSTAEATAILAPFPDELVFRSAIGGSLFGRFQNVTERENVSGGNLKNITSLCFTPPTKHVQNTYN